MKYRHRAVGELVSLLEKAIDRDRTREPIRGLAMGSHGQAARSHVEHTRYVVAVMVGKDDCGHSFADRFEPVEQSIERRELVGIGASWIDERHLAPPEQHQIGVSRRR